ncbi:MAG: PEP-CTERM sorting domain-containing protein [Candidatus Auribacter fodinae]|uniref:PEP-CTERM sorting domain-containing protein n=1 Tax=Candidatus Auribacter fodinae TaxID=2093366 RepID=A0A3A4R6M0_9BACT|nr:MAG: PEP-CTERM sorting domain-containing protein [Candidatus Auribacter fodinae]
METAHSAGRVSLSYVELIRHGVEPIPEPATVVLILAGITGLVRRKLV